MNLQEIDVGAVQHKLMFPSARYSISRHCDIYLGDTPVAIVCTEFLPGDKDVMLHLYVHPKYKSRESVEAVRRVFFDLYKPWVKSCGRSGVLATCDDTDATITTRAFLNELGFSMNPIWIGGVSLKED